MDAGIILDGMDACSLESALVLHLCNLFCFFHFLISNWFVYVCYVCYGCKFACNMCPLNLNVLFFSFCNLLNLFQCAWCRIDGMWCIWLGMIKVPWDELVAWWWHDEVKSTWSSCGAQNKLITSFSFLFLIDL